MQRRLRITLCLIIISISDFAYSATIFVDGQLSSNCNGNYSIANRNCTGSDGNAYKSIQQAINAITSPGSQSYTIEVRSGTYGQPLNGSGSYWWGIDFNKVGTETYPIMIRKYPSDSTKPLIKWNDDVTLPAGNYVCILFQIGADDNPRYLAGYLTLDNLEFQGKHLLNCQGEQAIGNSSGQSVKPITVQYCDIHDFDAFGIREGHKLIVEYCRIYNIGLESRHHAIYTWGPSCVFRYNHIYDIYGFGIHQYSESHTPGGDGIIAYNIIRNTTVGAGILVNGSNWKVYNNTCYWSRWPIWLNGADGSEVRNNLCINGYEYGIYISAANNVTVTNNIMYSTRSTYDAYGNQIVWAKNCTPRCTFTNNQQGADPKFIVKSPTDWLDFRIQSTSPARDAGCNAGTYYQNGLDPNNTRWPPTTVNQNTQGPGWEIGAFVYRRN